MLPPQEEGFTLPIEELILHRGAHLANLRKKKGFTLPIEELIHYGENHGDGGDYSFTLPIEELIPDNDQFVIHHKESFHLTY